VVRLSPAGGCRLKVRVADACVGVTDGVITKADVANFIAGQ
jgi:hypothetical protein